MTFLKLNQNFHPNNNIKVHFPEEKNILNNTFKSKKIDSPEQIDLFFLNLTIVVYILSNKINLVLVVCKVAVLAQFFN